VIMQPGISQCLEANLGVARAIFDEENLDGTRFHLIHTVHCSSRAEKKLPIPHQFRTKSWL
jgi:hypothetical protein